MLKKISSTKIAQKREPIQKKNDRAGGGQSRESNELSLSVHEVNYVIT